MVTALVSGQSPTLLSVTLVTHYFNQILCFIFHVGVGVGVGVSHYKNVPLITRMDISTIDRYDQSLSISQITSQIHDWDRSWYHSMM